MNNETIMSRVLYLLHTDETYVSNLLCSNTYLHIYMFIFSYSVSCLPCCSFAPFDTRELLRLINPTTQPHELLAVFT